MYTHFLLHVYIHIHICIHICIHIHIYMYIHIHMYIYTHIYVYTYMYVVKKAPTLHFSDISTSLMYIYIEQHQSIYVCVRNVEGETVRPRATVVKRIKDVTLTPLIYIYSPITSVMYVYSNKGSHIHLFAHNYTHLSICIHTAPSLLSRMCIETKAFTPNFVHAVTRTHTY